MTGTAGTPEPFGAEAHAEGRGEAAALYGRLVRGEEFSPYHPSGLVLGTGEDAYGEGVVEYSRYYGMQVQYTERSTFAFGGPAFVVGALVGTAIANAAERRAANRQAAPQWRFEGFPRVLLTNRRILVHSPVDCQWLSFWHSGLLEFGPQVESYALYLGYPECAPVMLHGPIVPWLSVAFAFCVYPRHDLINLPFFGPLANQAGLIIGDSLDQSATNSRERST